MATRRKNIRTQLAAAKQQLELQRVRTERRELKLKDRALRMREKLSVYASAEKNRHTEDWKARTLTADEAIIPDGPTLVARARQSRRDNWMTASATFAFKRSIVGTGINPRSNARAPITGDLKKGDAFDVFNKTVNWWWRLWSSKPRWCDVECRRTFAMMESYIAEEWPIAGQAFAILCYRPRLDMCGLALQFFEVEQLDHTMRTSPDTGFEIRDGIEIEPKTSAPVAYWVFTEGIDGQIRSKSERLPAERVIHIYDPQRVRQTHGVTRFAPVLTTIRHTSMYEEYQILAARYEAIFGGVIESDAATGINPGLPPGLDETGLDANGNEELILEPGLFPRTKPGEKVNWFDPKRPGTSYEPFVKTQTRHVGAGIDLDGALLERNFTDGSYTAQRQGQNEADKATDPAQAMMFDLFVQRVREEFKLLLLLEKRVKAPGYFSDTMLRDAYLTDEWAGPPKKWIDEAKQAAAAKIQVEQRFRPLSDIHLEQGYFTQEVAQQTAEDEAVFEDAGVALPREISTAAPPVDKREPRPGYESDNEPVVDEPAVK